MMDFEQLKVSLKDWVTDDWTTNEKIAGATSMLSMILQSIKHADESEIIEWDLVYKTMEEAYKRRRVKPTVNDDEQ